MQKFIWAFILSAAIGSVVSGCKSAGSREFIPGRGWRTTELHPALPTPAAAPASTAPAQRI